MGDVADQLIDEEMFGKRWGRPTHRAPRDPESVIKAKKKIAFVRKEIAIMVQSGVDIQIARGLINKKYGKGWRERGLTNNPDDQWDENPFKPFSDNEIKKLAQKTQYDYENEENLRK